ncbi:MAG: ribonuclease, partial [Polaromonas sp.]|nr:ribonuclease [Polaromonas sp.]
VSLVSSAGLAAFGNWASAMMPGWDKLLYVINIALSIGITTTLFAMIFKVMPQVKLGWRDVWTGALVTAVLFEVGKWLISLYIGKSSVTSSFAAAGSLVVLLVWVYYSAQIFLLGAEFTWVYANEHGSLAGSNNATSPVAAAAPAVPSGSTASQPASPAANVPEPPVQSDLIVIRPFSSLPGPTIPDEPPHPSLKQRAIVYGSSAAAYMALRLLLKRKGRDRMGLPGS